MAVPYNDSFTNSNGTLITSHDAGWDDEKAAGANTPEIDTNQLLFDSAGQNHAPVRDDVLADASVTATFTIQTQTVRWYGLCARMQGAGTEDFYSLTWENDNTPRLKIREWTSFGTDGTELGSSAAWNTVSNNTAYKMRLECEGTTIRGRMWLASGAEPGTWDIEVTDATYSSGRWGFLVYTANNRSVRADDFSLDELSADQTINLTQPSETETSQAVSTPKVIVLGQATETETSQPWAEAELPQTISDLAGWWDATKITGLSDGAAVSQWDDSSGANRHATQGTAGNQPTYQTGEMNGRPVVRFDGTDDYLGYDGSFLVGTQYTIFVVARPVSPNEAGNFFLGGTTEATNENLHFGWNAADQMQFAQWNSDLLSSSGLTPSATGEIYTARKTGSGSEMWQGSTSRGSNANSATLVAYVGASIGAYRPGALIHAFRDDIAEVLIYERALSDSERDDIWSYLTDKWISADQTVNLTQPSETETAQTATTPKLVQDFANSQVTETETAQATITPKVVALGQATETETSQAVTWPKDVAVAQTTETETAQAITAQLGEAQTVNLGQVTETETSQATTTPKLVQDFANSQVTEPETAQAVTTPKDVGLAQTVEAETAQTVTVDQGSGQTIALGQVSETETSQANTLLLTVAVTQALETETGQAVTAPKVVAVAQGTETEGSQHFTNLKAVPVAQVTETEIAQLFAVAGPQTISLGQVTELETAQGWEIPPRPWTGPRSNFVTAQKRRRVILTSKLWI